MPAFIILHNKKPVHVCTGGEDAEEKLNKLKAEYCLKKDFQVAQSDSWEILEVPLN